jgi:hypothetical protein
LKIVGCRQSPPSQEQCAQVQKVRSTQKPFATQLAAAVGILVTESLSSVPITNGSACMRPEALISGADKAFQTAKGGPIGGYQDAVEGAFRKSKANGTRGSPGLGVCTQ